MTRDELVDRLMMLPGDAVVYVLDSEAEWSPVTGVNMLNESYYGYLPTEKSVGVTWL